MKGIKVATEFVGLPNYGGKYVTKATIKLGKETLCFCGEGVNGEMSAFNCHVSMEPLKRILDHAYQEVLEEHYKYRPNRA